MNKKFLFLLLGIIALGVIFAVTLKLNINRNIPLIQQNRLSQLDHIVIIVMENKSYNDVVGNQSAPYINSLIQSNSFADNYSAVSHPSLPNYLALIGGSTFGITNDCTDCYVSSINLVDSLEQAHKTWKAYMESMPYPCFIGSNNLYVQKHNPFIYFDNIRNNGNRCKNIVPFTQLQSDLGSINSTPNFVWITPNVCNDMHDCSVATGEKWLSEQVSQILKSPAFIKQKSLLVITWDEAEGSGSNRVPAILIGNATRKGFISRTPYSHYSLLGTVESIWNMPPLTTNTALSTSMSDFLKKQ